MRFKHCRHAIGLVGVAMSILAAGPAWAGRDCDAPPETWQPRSAVGALAERNGWRVDRLKIDDGCYEIKGRDAAGRRLEVRLDPASLRVIGIKRGHDEHDRDDLPRPEAPPAAWPDFTPPGED